MLAALTLVCFVAATTAIKCHTCTYSKIGDAETGAACNDAYSADNSGECSDGVTYCSKTTGSGKVDGNDAKSIVRMCGVGCTKVGSTDAGTDDGDATIYCCEGDDCNSASAILPTLGLLLVSLTLTRAF